MATVHGKNATVSMDDKDGTPRDISPYCNEVEISFELDTQEDTAFGDSSRTRIAGLKDVSLSISGMYDTTATVGSDTVVGPAILDAGATTALLTFSISFDGGTITYAGEGLVTSYNPTASYDGKVEFSMEVVGSGTWTRT